MSYINAGDRLLAHILELIQDYVEGEYIYIPKKESNKKSWGESTNTKKNWPVVMKTFTDSIRLV